jgi:hypothetical protein
MHTKPGWYSMLYHRPVITCGYTIGYHRLVVQCAIPEVSIGVGYWYVGVP